MRSMTTEMDLVEEKRYDMSENDPPEEDPDPVDLMFVLRREKGESGHAVHEIRQAQEIEVYYFKSNPYHPTVEDEEGHLFATINLDESVKVLKKIFYYTVNNKFEKSTD